MFLYFIYIFNIIFLNIIEIIFYNVILVGS